MKAFLCTVAALGVIAFAGAALAEGGCHSTKPREQSAEVPPPPPPAPRT